MCSSSGGRDFVPWGTPRLLNCGYRLSFLGVERPGRGVDHPPLSSAEVKERVELYLYSPSGKILCSLLVLYLVWDSAFVKISGHDYRNIYADRQWRIRVQSRSFPPYLRKLQSSSFLFAPAQGVQSRSAISVYLRIYRLHQCAWNMQVLRQWFECLQLDH